jgi:excisionase family DNA binding protein
MVKGMYTTEEAAMQLGVTSARVRQMILDGTLPAEKFGRDLLITAEAIGAAKLRKTKPGPTPKPKADKASGTDGHVNVKASKKGHK